MRHWLLLSIACGAPQEPPPKPVVALPPPPPASTSAAPIASAPPLPSSLVVPYGIESRAQATLAAPPKGFIAVSCRTLEGEAADDLGNQNWQKTFQACKVPAKSRFVIRIDGKAHVAKGTIDREGAEEKVAKCVSDALVPAAAMLDEHVYDCYVAFY